VPDGVRVAVMLGQPEEVQALTRLVRRVRIRSRLFDVVVADPLGPGGRVDPFLRWLRPSFSVEVQGAPPLTFAPYGEPPGSGWAQAAAIVAGSLVGGLTLLGVLSLIRR